MLAVKIKNKNDDWIRDRNGTKDIELLYELIYFMYSNTKAYYNNIHKAKNTIFYYWETHMRTWHGAHHCTHHILHKIT